MSFEENVRAILNCNFSETKEEIIDIAVKRICELKDKYREGYSDGYSDGLRMVKMKGGAG